MIDLVKEEQFKAKIKVVGIGGCGNNAINAMIQSRIRGVEFIAMNTDLDVLRISLAEEKIQLGEKLTQGLGAGGDPEIGRQAAIESIEQIRDALAGAHMVFITAGMGGGTGTGGAPVVAEVAKEIGALTVAVVTKPFTGEGNYRNAVARSGIEELKTAVDALIVIDNNKLLMSSGKNLLAKDAFRLSNEPLVQAVRGISEIVTIPGYINVDFADVKCIMKETGVAVMGTAEGSGEERAVLTVKNAISNPLTEFNEITGAKGVLVNVTGNDITIQEFHEIVSYIQQESDEDARIIPGLVFDESMENKIRVTIIATGFGRKKKYQAHVPPHQVTEEFKDIETPAFLRKSPSLKKIVKGLKMENSAEIDPLKMAGEVFEKDDEESVTGLFKR